MGRLGEADTRWVPLLDRARLTREECEWEDWMKGWVSLSDE